MKKSTEIRKNYEEVKNKMQELVNSGKTEEAHGLIGEMDKLKNELELAVALENKLPDSNTLPTPGADAVNHTKLYNKLVLGKSLTPQEQELVNSGKVGVMEGTPDKGGYLVPEQQFRELLEEREKKVSLKKYCRVLPASSVAGVMPIKKANRGRLINFDEFTEIKQADLAFDKLNYKIGTYGLIIPISNEALQDAMVNLISLVKTALTEAAVLTENDKIIEIMKTAGLVEGTTEDAIRTTLNKELDPSYSSQAKIFTNQTSFDWLDGLKAADGRPLLSPSLKDPTKMVYKGREIVVIPDLDLAPTGPGVMDFYVGDMEEGVAFFERKGVAIAVSTEAGFTMNATMLRAIERFDVKQFAKDAFKHVAITPTTPKNQK